MSIAKELIESLKEMAHSESADLDESMAPPEHHETLTKAHFKYNPYTKRYENQHTDREITYKPRAKHFIVHSVVNKKDTQTHTSPTAAIERAHAKGD